MERLLNVVSLLSLTLAVFVLFSLRRQHIRVEYSVSWLVAAVILFLLSRWHAGLVWLAGTLGIADPTLALAMIIAGVFLAVFYRFSMILSHLKDANIALAQRCAILEFRLESLESKDEVTH
ncbi:MAG: DUF2304 domain-containing protein [Bryobacteraceae bacterium]